MKIINPAFLFAVIILLTISCRQRKGQVTVTTSFLPELVTINGKQTLYYELKIQNATSDSIALTKLEVIDTSASKFFASFVEEGLWTRIAQSSTRGRTLSPGSSSLIYMELSLPKDKSKFELVNHVEFETADKTTQLAQLTINQLSTTKTILGPPVSGGPWVAIFDPSWERGHRRVVYSIDSIDRIPGRFAIDFIRTDLSGKLSHNDIDSVENWFGYELDVIAVADGTIADTNDEFNESKTISGHIEQVPEKATGNYLVINIGNGNFAFYEHLKPGSIKVKSGQKVRKGDVIASIGFTGNTTGPHLHFHVANRNSALGAEGVAFAFEKFSVLGEFTNLQFFGEKVWDKQNTISTIVIGEHPSPNSVIIF